MTTAALTNARTSRLEADDGELANRFRALEEGARRRLACAMVRKAIDELSVSLPPQAVGLLGTGGVATPAQLADLDRRAARSGGSLSDVDFRRARALAAARYALSPQPRAAEEALHEALHARTSFSAALDEVRHQLH
jgi:hypothetical protein